MFPSPVRALAKLRRGKSCSWPAPPPPEVDFAAFRSGRASDDHAHASPHLLLTCVQSSPRRAPRTPRNPTRDTILLDLSNNDLIPALDYAFAIIDDDQTSTRSLPPPSPPKMPGLSRGSSPESSASSAALSPRSSTSASVRSSPPRYAYVPSPLSTSPPSSARPSPQKRAPRPAPAHRPTASFDPDELSLALAHAQAARSPDPSSPVSEHGVPFPPPAPPPATRVPLLLRKPRVHSVDSSIDGHEPLAPYRSYPGSSKASLARSVSSLGHHHDVFGARSTISLHSPDLALSALLAHHPPSRTYGSLRLFSKKPRQTPMRRASTPPPARGRLGIPSARPPVPALPEAFLLGPAARREASSTSPTLLSRAARADTAL